MSPSIYPSNCLGEQRKRRESHSEGSGSECEQSGSNHMATLLD